MSTYGSRSASIGANTLRSTFDSLKKGHDEVNKIANLTKFNIQQSPSKGPVNVTQEFGSGALGRANSILAKKTDKNTRDLPSLTDFYNEKLVVLNQSVM